MQRCHAPVNQPGDEMKQTALLPFAAKLALVMLSTVAFTDSQLGTAQATLGQAKRQQIFIDFFDVAEVPLRIDDATFSKTESGHVLKCSAVNRSAEQVFGFGFVLLVVGSSGQPRATVGWIERAQLADYGSKDFSIELPLRLKIRADDRVVLIVEQVFGRETIWKVFKAEDALTAYAAGEQYVIPEVKSISNQFDGIGAPAAPPSPVP